MDSTTQNLQEQMDNNVSKIAFALAKVTTEQFAVIENRFAEDGEFRLNVHFRFAADHQSKMIGVFANFTFECNSNPFIIVESGCHFNIKPDSWSELINTEKNELTVPKGMMQHLGVITVGTARGILHAKTEGTPFNQYLLPTVNVAEIITQDQVFQL